MERDFMINQVEQIKISDIQKNKLNNRSMDSSEIQNIAQNLSKGGVLEPLVVYKDGKKYTLLSGHRRLSALEMVLDGDDTVACVIVGKPATEIDEIEMLSRLNIHRSNPDDIQQEAILASRGWKTMPAERREALTEKYQKLFIKAHENSEVYQSDPEKYIKNNFRPRLDYVREMTGLEVSNSTVKDIISEKPKEEKVSKEVKEEQKKETKSDKRVTDKDLMRQAESLLGVLKVHETIDETLNAFKGMCSDSLETLIEYLR